MVDREHTAGWVTNTTERATTIASVDFQLASMSFSELSSACLTDRSGLITTTEGETTRPTSASSASDCDSMTSANSLTESSGRSSFSESEEERTGAARRAYAHAPHANDLLLIQAAERGDTSSVKTLLASSQVRTLDSFKL